MSRLVCLILLAFTQWLKVSHCPGHHIRVLAAVIPALFQEKQRFSQHLSTYVLLLFAAPSFE
jgi:hypothetical protein